MSSQTVPQLAFDFLPPLPVVVQQSPGQLSSDAGLLPLRQFDQRWNYTQRIAACLVDPKPQRQHSLLSMLRQRLFGILVAKAECHRIGANLRFAVTNLPCVVSPDDGQRAYDHYVQRGESEQRMDGLKNGLAMDRLSCHRFMAKLL